MIEALKSYRHWPLYVRILIGVVWATNVISDMTVATILNRLEPSHEAASALRLEKFIRCGKLFRSAEGCQSG